MQAMPVRVLQATHPDMVVGMNTASLRDYYLLTGLSADAANPAMAGDNQDYKDMDPVPTPTLR